MLRTTKDIIHILLAQSNLPPQFWIEALHTTNHLINIRPSRAIHHDTPHFRLSTNFPRTRISAHSVVCVFQISAPPHKINSILDLPAAFS
jgi:hypothetical protein